jgi:hypothetical protein
MILSLIIVTQCVTALQRLECASGGPLSLSAAGGPPIRL